MQDGSGRVTPLPGSRKCSPAGHSMVVTVAIFALPDCSSPKPSALVQQKGKVGDKIGRMFDTD